MKLSELKNGAIIETRNGLRYVKIDNTFFEIDIENIGGFISVDSYNEEMDCVNRHADTGKSIKKLGESLAYLGERDRFFDIVKVNNDAVGIHGYLNKAICRVVRFDEWTWQRPAPILDEVERDYLSKICKPLKTISLRKLPHHCVRESLECIPHGEYIDIAVTNAFGEEEHMDLPLFEEETMYKNMEMGRMYTPAELEL